MSNHAKGPSDSPQQSLDVQPSSPTHKSITESPGKSPEGKPFVTQDAKASNTLMKLSKGKDIADSHQKLNNLVDVYT